MNDMVQPSPLFHVTLNTEVIQTKMFGNVTVTELPNRRLTKILQAYDPKADGEAFAFALLSESACGEQGEHFTPAILESLPNRALRDLRSMIVAAIRLNGLNGEEVEKA